MDSEIYNQLLEKARNANNSEDALRYTQAAINAIQVEGIKAEIERYNRTGATVPGA